MILPGMHKHIKEWDETLTARGLSTGALVHRIQDSMFTSEAEKRLSTKWNPPAVPERAGTRHPSSSAARGIQSCERGTPYHAPLVLWFAKCLETLEVVESGTWSDLSVAHRDMLPLVSPLLAWPIGMGLFPLLFPPLSCWKALGLFLVHWSAGNATTNHVGFSLPHPRCKPRLWRGIIKGLLDDAAEDDHMVNLTSIISSLWLMSEMERTWLSRCFIIGWSILGQVVGY